MTKENSPLDIKSELMKFFLSEEKTIEIRLNPSDDKTDFRLFFNSGKAMEYNKLVDDIALLLLKDDLNR